MGKHSGGPATDPEVVDETDCDETTVGWIGAGEHERTGMRRAATPAPDSLDIELDLARTHSSELPTFEHLVSSAAMRPRSSRGPDSTADDAIPVQFQAESEDDDLALSETSAWRVPPRANPAELIGKIVAGRYELGPVLGAGGMGTVFQAQHTDLGKQVAIKVLASVLDGQDEAKQRFIREAKAASTIESEHIAQVFDIGEDFHLGLYMVMELLKGQDLSHVLAAHGSLRPEAAAGIGWQLCLALERAHAASVVHRDLKPANVFLTSRDDGSVKVKVLDFGIAKLLRDARKTRRGGITGSGLVVGTPQYMSPEQAQGLSTVDHRTDLYSVGALLFETITGTPPFPELDSHEQTLLNILSQTPPRLASRIPAIPPALDALVAELMTRDPERRPSSARAVRARLAAIFPALETRTVALGESPDAAPLAVVPRTGSGVTVDSTMGAAAGLARHPRPALLYSAVALAVTTLLVALFTLRSKPSSNEPGRTTLTAAQATLEPPPTAIPAPPATGVAALAAVEEEAAELVHRAQSALERGDLQTARDLALDAVRRAPASAEGWLTLGAAHEALGDGAAARAAYQSCTQQTQGERTRECAALLER